MLRASFSIMISLHKHPIASRELISLHKLFSPYPTSQDINGKNIWYPGIKNILFHATKVIIHLGHISQVQQDTTTNK